MKNVFVLLLFIFSVTSFAHSEHKDGEENRPSREKLTFYHGCFNEISDLGCGHPRDGQEIFNSCLHDNHNDLTPACRNFFKTLYGKKGKKHR